MWALPLSLLLLLSSAQASPCPDGYTQAPNGGDCYKGSYYYQSPVGIYSPRDCDSVEEDCNNAGGGMLASLHSEEEAAFVFDFRNTCYPPGRTSSGPLDIGLRCIGLNCKWDDGSPLTYTNFKAGDEPVDDGATRCYTMAHSTKWERRFPKNSCGKDTEGDSSYRGQECWICSVKAQTIECDANEYEYKGGCVSVHTTPLDQKTAEQSCPGGGHLVSIHSGNENNFYQQFALNAGVTGTFYIGGQWSNGKFEWIDGSHENTDVWANGFPNTIFGACSQMLLASEFGSAGQWTNVDCSAKLPYICLRMGYNYAPFVPPTPTADPKCPPIQYYTGAGTIYSPNYPLSVPSQQTCEYVIEEEEGTKASIKFMKYDISRGVSLSFYDGLNTNEPFIYYTGSPNINQTYSATTNILKIVFSVPTTAEGTGWEAEYYGIT